MLLKKISFLFFIFCFFVFHSSAQHFTRCDTIPVFENSKQLKFPWQGGHDYCQFSNLDINNDGINDLFVFDRTGNKISCYISKGTKGVVDYLDSTIKYAPYFPTLQFWVLCVDYNCDGKADIFTSSVNPSGIRVYKNISAPFGPPQFVLEKNYLYAGANFIPANSIGIPAITDVDGDGDIDILTYAAGNFTMDLYINQSKDLYGNCDSLTFNKYGGCWGHFQEGGSSSCAIGLHTCSIANPTGEKTAQTNDDNGSSCSLCLDLNGDGIKELLLGQSSCCTLMQLDNNGTPDTADIVSYTTNFPANTPVNVHYNPCGFYADVNNDSIRDLIVSPNLANVSVNNESIWYYENSGTDNNPTFSRKTRSFLQEEMIDVGQGADPVFFDYDNDGLQDLIISNYVMAFDSCAAVYSYGVRAFKNIGSASSPKFSLADTDYATIAVQLPNITNKHLTFGDVNNDGDNDLFIGDYNGNLHYFTNTAPIGQPANFVLTQANYKDANNTIIDVGSNATPQLIDIDRDGDLDLIVGDRDGDLNFFQNIGTKTVPSYSLVSNFFGGVDAMKPCCTGFSVPFIYDFGGKYKMLLGSEATRGITGPNTGWIWMFDSIENNLAGKFHPLDSMVQKIWEGPHMIPFGKDINGDGKMDLAIGNYCGGVAIYLGDTLTTGILETAQINEFDFSIFPNPTNNQFTVYGFQFPVQIQILNSLGQIIFEKYISEKQELIKLNEPAGIYFCKVSGRNFSKTKKLIVLK